MDTHRTGSEFERRLLHFSFEKMEPSKKEMEPMEVERKLDEEKQEAEHKKEVMGKGNERSKKLEAHRQTIEEERRRMESKKEESDTAVENAEEDAMEIQSFEDIREAMKLDPKTANISVADGVTLAALERVMDLITEKDAILHDKDLRDATFIEEVGKWLLERKDDHASAAMKMLVAVEDLKMETREEK